jgi:NADH-quinone oxidoreductase subunit J
MVLGVAAQYVAFTMLAFIAIAGALGMTTTMSMFRSAIFLMASFIGVGGLFILLMADLLGMLQVMMYIGGMLVMALFMVLFSGDPGGAMMTSMMSLPLPEKVFSLGLKRKDMMNHDHNENGDEQHDEHQHGHDHECSSCSRKCQRRSWQR